MSVTVPSGMLDDQGVNSLASSVRDCSHYPGMRAKRISGKHIDLREVEVTDAEYILSLRLDPRHARYLSPTSSDAQSQRDWILKYQRRFDQAYFVAESRESIPRPCGTVRLYDPVGNSFSWGSWLLGDNAPSFAAIESALIVYDYGFNVLGFSASHFEVLRENMKVCAFHERFGARQVGEDTRLKYYNLTREDYIRLRTKYARYALEKIAIVL